MEGLLLGLIIGLFAGANLGYLVFAFLRRPCPPAASMEEHRR